MRSSSPSGLKRKPVSAPQSRAAYSTSVSRTGWSINRKTANNLEHFARRCLLLQRLAEVAITFLQFLGSRALQLQ